MEEVCMSGPFEQATRANESIRIRHHRGRTRPEGRSTGCPWSTSRV